MLYIESYDRQSLDRSTNSLIDKFIGQIDDLSKLSQSLLSVVQSLFSVLSYISDILDSCKRKLLASVEQFKEDATGNGIDATSTIKTIEDYINAGDTAIQEAEETLTEVEENINCDEAPSCSYCSYSSCDESTCNYTYDGNCSESGYSACGEENVVVTPPSCIESGGIPEDCSYCSYVGTVTDGTHITIGESCDVCNHDGCKVDIDCSEKTDVTVNSTNTGEVTTRTITDCSETIVVNDDCKQTTCDHDSYGWHIPENCTYSCSHSAPCSESPTPGGCTYSCTYSCADDGCSYGGDGCSYATVCNEGVTDTVCSQTASDQCGQPCGETCHMTTTPEERPCDEDCDDSCSDSGDSGDCTDGGDCGEGQTCADNCSFDSGTEDGCAEGSCGEGSCGML